MFYHASSAKNIEILEPRISNHNIPLIYFSEKRENVLVYLSNAIEKYCKETSFGYSGVWHKWAAYGFNKDGILNLEEYYPNALKETYQGVSGYIYCAEYVEDSGDTINIPDAVTSRKPVKVTACEYIENAYNEIIKAEANKLITVTRFEEMSENKRRWITETMKKEYSEAGEHPEYRYFIENKFGIKI